MRRSPLRKSPNKLFTVLLALRVFAAAAIAEARVDTYFSPNDDTKGVAFGELGLAKHRVDAILPDLNDESLISEMKAMAERKLRVRVVTSRASLEDPSKCKSCDVLELAGADVRLIEPRIAHRVLIIDGPQSKSASGILGRILTANGAFGAPRRGESLIAIQREGELTLLYQDEFNFVWTKAKDYDDAASFPDVNSVRVPNVAFAQFSSANMVPIELEDGFQFTPSLDKKVGVMTESLVVAINQAYDALDLSARSLANNQIYTAIERALARGVRVKLLLPQKEWNGAPAQSVCHDVIATKSKKSRRFFDECLAARGAEIAYAAGVQGTTLITDGKLALTGAVDLTRGREMRRFSHLLTLRGEALRPHQKQFDALYATGMKPPRATDSVSVRNIRAELRPKSGGECRGIIPVNYSFAEMMRVRSELRSKARGGQCR